MHRDYCGIGLFVNEARVFTVAHVNDGYPSDVLATFPDEKAFVAWLQAQSDWTMSGVDGGALPREEGFALNNQRITGGELQAFVVESKKSKV